MLEAVQVEPSFFVEESHNLSTPVEENPTWTKVAAFAKNVFISSAMTSFAIGFGNAFLFNIICRNRESTFLKTAINTGVYSLRATAPVMFIREMVPKTPHWLLEKSTDEMTSWDKVQKIAWNISLDVISRGVVASFIPGIAAGMVFGLPILMVFSVLRYKTA